MVCVERSYLVKSLTIIFDESLPSDVRSVVFRFENDWERYFLQQDKSFRNLLFKKSLLQDDTSLDYVTYTFCLAMSYFICI